ncbi:multicopper oxidase domain-containing protein [Arcanobacterium haemolyticum]|nr:multicopper oxidase domain-containing protein [Arcanobacterium haemolyticum]
MTDHSPIRGIVTAVATVIVIALALLIAKPALTSQADDRALSPMGSSSQTIHADIRVEGMSFSPTTITVPTGASLEVTFTNTGSQTHDLVFENATATSALAPGESETITVGTIKSSMKGWCSLPGHRQMGMELNVTTTPGTSDSTTNADSSYPAGHDRHGEESISPTMDQLIAQAANSEPYPAELPHLEDSSIHEYTFTVSETEQDLGGVTRTLWTYNGSSPGPTLHGRVGDRFIITLKNEGSMGHSIDFHAGELAPDGPMRTINPGESLVYEFTATRSGIWMYHCSTMPMSLHIANGMFGAVVIEPDSIENVDRSYVLMQSELYLGADAATKLGSLTPDLMAFNGFPFQYDAYPLEVKVGERVRVWLLNIGPNLDESFHVVGEQFDTVWSEGHYSVYHGQSTDGLTQGNTGAQALSLSAAQGGFIEFVPEEAGAYPFVNHKMSLAEKGAHGIFQVSD